jgi:uncharacterized protein
LTALVTGASSGIGLELTKLLARDGNDLALVGRDRKRLDALAGELSQRFHVAINVLVHDLADPAAPAAIVRELSQKSVTVDVLVNCAGFGSAGFFAETPISTELEIIQVNVTAPTHLTALLLPGMLERRYGGILNVASTAAFQPGPLMAVYYATKAYLLSFSEALANETRGTGVRVTTLCPGPTRTDFQRRAGLKEVLLFRGPLVSSAEDVARAGYEGWKRGKRLVIPGIANRILIQAERLTPRRLTMAITRRLQESRN